MMDLSVVPYDHAKIGSPPAGDGELRYRECMRNHAASLGGQAFDGCGEFMPSSSPDPLKCAACGCHRNFHRRDDPGGDVAFAGRPLLLAPPPPAYFPSPFARMPPPPLPPAARMGSETPPRMDGGGGGEGSSATRKRNRTKFTAEQKERMQAFAERIGWRIQRQDDVALEEFCGEIGVKRHVLKVWMHNNKSHLSSSAAKREEVTAVAGAAPASVEGISV